MFKKKQRNYVKLTMDAIRIESEGIICGSKPTVMKEFTVKTDDYELEGDNWANNSITFD